MQLSIERPPVEHPQAERSATERPAAGSVAPLGTVLTEGQPFATPALHAPFDGAGAFPRALTDTQEALFEHGGYLPLERMASAADVAAIRGEIHALLQGGGTFRADFHGIDPLPAGPATPPPLRNLHASAPLLLQTRFYRDALALARQVMGPDARLARDEIVIKPPRDGAATPWHQSEATGDSAFQHRELSLALALDNLDAESGCLRFIPGSHRGGVVRHVRLSGPDGGVVLDCGAAIDPIVAVSCPVPAGGCTLHTMATITATAPNRSDRQSWIYVVTFCLPTIPAETKRDFPWRAETGWRHMLRRLKPSGRRHG